MIRDIKGNKKIIISHIADIDGMGSVILAKKYFQDIDYILCEVSDLSDIFLGDFSMYDEVFLCDLSITNDAIDVIEANEGLIEKLRHFDHHITMINDNTPAFCNYVPEIDGRKTCGTELFFRYLTSLDEYMKTDFNMKLVEAIRANDTWDKDGEFELGRKLASIHAMVGSVPFIELILSWDDTKELVIPDIFESLVKADEEKMRRYIFNANNNLYKTTYKDYKIGVTVSEQYRSILGDEICKMNPELDFAFIINLERMSVSLRCVRDDINLGEISLEFHPNAGGHRKAAGFILDNISIPKVEKYYIEYLNNKKEN